MERELGTLPGCFGWRCKRWTRSSGGEGGRRHWAGALLELSKQSSGRNDHGETVAEAENIGGKAQRAVGTDPIEIDGRHGQSPVFALQSFINVDGGTLGTHSHPCKLVHPSI